MTDNERPQGDCKSCIHYPVCDNKNYNIVTPCDLYKEEKKGEWEPILDEDGTPYWEENYEPMFLCTRCKCKSYKKTFCPHCGAEMREGET